MAIASPSLSIAATFTAEPLEESLAFWFEELGLDLPVRFAPYNQIFQSILDAGGPLYFNPGGVNAVLIREGDWAAAGPDAFSHLARSIQDSSSAADWIVVTCPPSPGAAAVSDSEDGESLLRSIPGLQFGSWREVLNLYPVAEVHDQVSDSLGAVPYSKAFYAALGTWIARRAVALRTAPFKVLALDCDNTLWRGVCGEDGPAGVAVDPGRRALQEFALAQREAGMLLSLASKNNEADVFETLAAHPEMPLRPEHLSAWRIGWEAKSASLTAIAAELGVGLDSLVFLDDDRRECAEVEADCPGVAAVPLPGDDADIPEFLRHVWAFDRPRVTEADRLRAAQYAQRAERQRAERQAGTLAEFIAGLGLQTTIAAPAPERLARVAQLTQRTNQMNCSCVRRTESELRAELKLEKLECLTVDVSDRFGDYGLVGVVLFRAANGRLQAETFLLSCRALGRGVEHRMLARLGELARARGIPAVEIPFIPTARNAPARQFLESLAAAVETRDGGAAFVLTSDAAAAAEWRPSADPVPALQSPAPVPSTAARRSIDYARIAGELRGVDRILEAIKRRQPAKAAAPASPDSFPREGVEMAIAAIWSGLLGVEPIGRDENFFDLGGHSLVAIQMLSRIRRELGAELSLDVVYGGPLTVAELARVIELGELGAVSPEEYEALLHEIEAMPDDRVRALLEAEEGSRP